MAALVILPETTDYLAFWAICIHWWLKNEVSLGGSRRLGNPQGRVRYAPRTLSILLDTVCPEQRSFLGESRAWIRFYLPLRAPPRRHPHSIYIPAYFLRARLISERRSDLIFLASSLIFSSISAFISCFRYSKSFWS